MFTSAFNLFGKKKQQTSSIVSNKRQQIDMSIDAIQILKPQLGIITKRNSFLELKIENITKDVRANLNHKSKCLLLLQSKKNIEAELQKNYGIQTIMENQLASLESSIINIHMIKATEDGNRVIQNAHSDLSIDRLEDLLDDIKEQEQVKATMADLFSQQVNNVYTDDELSAEFNTYLTEDEHAKELTKQPVHIPIGALPIGALPIGALPIGALPSVPPSDLRTSNVLPISVSDPEEERYIKELQMTMN